MPPTNEQRGSESREVSFLRLAPSAWKFGCVGIGGAFLIAILLIQVGDHWVLPGLMVWSLILVATQFRIRRCRHCGVRTVLAPARVGHVLMYGVKCLRCGRLAVKSDDSAAPDSGG